MWSKRVITPGIRSVQSGMICVSHMICTFTVTVCFASHLTSAASDPTVYIQDFSSDPRWITDQPTNYYWSSDTGTFTATAESALVAPNPSRYAYIPTTLNTSTSFTLQWDENITHSDSDAYAAFGLFCNDLNPSNLTPTGGSPLMSQGNFNLQLGYGGQLAGVAAMTNGGPSGGESVKYPSFIPQQTWLRNTLIFNSQTNTVSGSVRSLTTGATLFALGPTQLPGPFRTDMVNLGFAKPPPGIDYARTSGQSTTVSVDNIRLIQAAPLAPPSSGPRPLDNPPTIDTSTAKAGKGLIFIIHGWDADLSWTNAMKSDITATLTTQGLMSHWDVDTYDWSKYDGTFLPSEKGVLNPGVAVQNARQIGMYVGSQLRKAGYTQIHFIAHSAGAWLAQEAANALAGSGITIQTTFLDAFAPHINTPLGLIGQDPDALGVNMASAEQYVDSRGAGVGGLLPFTNETLKNAYNVDVTALDAPHLADPSRWHAWPHVWYDQTASNPSGPAAQAYGFQLAMEYSGQLPTGAPYAKGSRVYLTPTVSASSRTAATSSPQLTFEDESTSVQMDSPLSFGSLAQATSSSGLISTTDPTTIRLATADAPNAWISVLVSLSATTNVLAFDYQFLSAGQGFMSIYIDGQLVSDADQRLDGTQLNSQAFWLGENIAPGVHDVAINLDAVAAEPSALEVSNIQFGAIPEPLMLSLWIAIMYVLGVRGRGSRLAV